MGFFENFGTGLDDFFDTPIFPKDRKLREYIKIYNEMDSKSLRKLRHNVDDDLKRQAIELILDYRKNNR